MFDIRFGTRGPVTGPFFLQITLEKSNKRDAGAALSRSYFCTFYLWIWKITI
jgi:hypothetical protein